MSTIINKDDIQFLPYTGNQKRSYLDLKEEFKLDINTLVEIANYDKGMTINSVVEHTKLVVKSLNRIAKDLERAAKQQKRGAK